MIYSDSTYDLSIECIFLFIFTPYYWFLLFMLTYCSVVVFIVLECFPRGYWISTEAKNIKITQWQRKNLAAGCRYLFIAYFCSYFLIQSLFVLCMQFFWFNNPCIAIFPSHVLTENYTTSQHNSINRKEEGRHILCYFVYFIIS